jgi:hypothetical protein
MSFNINNTLLGKLFINNSYYIYNLNKVIKFHEIIRKENWICNFSYQYNNKNILISNIFLHNDKKNISYEELLYKDMNNSLLVLDTDFHIILKNKKTINIDKIPKTFYKEYL